MPFSSLVEEVGIWPVATKYTLCAHPFGFARTHLLLYAPLAFAHPIAFANTRLLLHAPGWLYAHPIGLIATSAKLPAHTVDLGARSVPIVALGYMPAAPGNYWHVNLAPQAYNKNTVVAYPLVK